MKLLEELMNHLGDSQGSELKTSLDESRMPKMEIPESGLESEGEPGFDQMASDAIGDVAEGEKTLGETIGYPGFGKKQDLMEGTPDEVAMSNEEDMTDEELEELLRRTV